MKTKTGNSEFTKGPWQVATLLPETYEIKAGSRAFDLSPIDWKTASPAEMFANAHLIAAAPELYEALEDVCLQMEYMATWDKHGQSYYKAKRALLKARGEK